MRNKIIGIFIAVLLIVPLGWIFFQLAPVPKSPGKQTKPASAPLPELKASGKETPDRSDEPGFQYSTLMSLLGESVGKGTLNISLESYCGELETRYRQRGFRDYRAIEGSANKDRNGGLTKIFWGSCEGPVAVINAVGEDANPLSAEKADPGSQYTTIIEKKRDAIFWETYRIGEKARNLEDSADFPGEDPPLVPRIEDSQRLFGLNQAGKYTVIYQTAKSVRETLDWYALEFARLKFEKNEVPVENGSLAFFAKDKYFCTLWLSKNEVDGKTMILITLQN